MFIFRNCVEFLVLCGLGCLLANISLPDFICLYPPPSPPPLFSIEFSETLDLFSEQFSNPPSTPTNSGVAL